MLYIGADHRGYNLKEKIKIWLISQNVEFEDLGARELIPEDDYPDYAKLVAQETSKNLKENKGILICGSGAGVCVVANKFKGIRCATVFSPEMAKSVKGDDDINILALASDFTNESAALKMIEVWLNTPLKPDKKYARRIKKIKEIEDNICLV